MKERRFHQAALDSIFEPFSRGALGPSKQGLGLGLYISSNIAKAHGGSLDSVHGEGASIQTDIARRSR